MPANLVVLKGSAVMPRVQNGLGRVCYERNRSRYPQATLVNEVCCLVMVLG